MPKTLGSKKHLILGLGLPSTIRLPRMRLSIRVITILVSANTPSLRELRVLLRHIVQILQSQWDGAEPQGILNLAVSVFAPLMTSCSVWMTSLPLSQCHLQIFGVHHAPSSSAHKQPRAHLHPSRRRSQRQQTIRSTNGSCWKPPTPDEGTSHWRK